MSRDRSPTQPWLNRAGVAPPRTRRAVVIGAGLAGAAAAASLARRGFEVTVLERAAEAAAGASGNVAGMAYPHAALPQNPAAQLSHQAIGYLWGEVARLERGGATIDHDRCGVLVIPVRDGEATRLPRLEAENILGARWLPQNEAQDRAAVDLTGPGLFLPDGGWISPRQLCAAWLADGAPRGAITLLTHHHVLTLRSSTEGWIVEGSVGGGDSKELAAAETLVIANAADARGFAPLSWLGVIPVRGQVDVVEPSSATAALRCVVTGAAYIAPAAAAGGRHVMGATFDRESLDLAPRLSDSAEIRAGVARLMPSAAALGAAVASRAAVRATSLDALPLVGWVPEATLYRSVFADLHRGLKPEDFPPAPAMPGLYVLTGLGSRGIVNAGLCAEILAAQICAEPPPVDEALQRCLLPARFLVRALRSARNFR